MKARIRYLTGVLLLLIGILAGTLISLYRAPTVENRSQLEITEIKRNSTPVLTDSALRKIDSRFLLKEVAEKVRPTVVYIESMVSIKDSHLGSEHYRNRDDSFWDKLFPDRRVKTVGSGVIVSSDGYIVTNNHVVEGAVEKGINVILDDKRQFKAEVVGTDPSTDLAVLKIEETGLPAATIGNSNEIEVGEWVMAVGNPFKLRSTVTAGIVSALHRDVQVINVENELRVESFIQTDAAINKGNSGGALVDVQGRLIGINTAIASKSGNYQGYGFAVPVNLAIKVAKDLIEFGEVRRAFLGISMRPVDDKRAESLGMEKIRGAEILEIMDNSAAEVSGLEVGDVILKIDENMIDEPNELQLIIAEHHPGDRIRITVWRDQQKLDIPIVLKSVERTNRSLARLDDSDDPTKDDGARKRLQKYVTYELGIQVVELAKPEDARETELVITKVFHGSVAWSKGLRKGYVIQRVGENTVENLKELENYIAESLNKNGSVRFFVKKTNNETQYIKLTKRKDS